MKITDRELDTVIAVFDSLVDNFEYDELNKFLGSVTINEMLSLSTKLDHREYCDEHGIEYENMTEEDFENYHEWLWEC